ncbi:MAG TPA: hypothetical protein VME46_03900 [Acidimicrobiales bacterium]|nr:hypothetical protein [Acidimicrobiales bacterium]
MKFGWLSPHFNVFATVLAVGITVYLVAVVPVYGRRSYARLVAARPVDADAPYGARTSPARSEPKPCSRRPLAKGVPPLGRLSPRG